MLWMVESRQSFQIWRKASVKAWRWARGSQKSTADERMLKEAVCVTMSQFYCLHQSVNIAGHKNWILFIVSFPTILGRGPSVEKMPEE